MDRYLVKTEHKKTEPKKRQRAAVVRDDDDDDAVIVGKVEYDLHFMDQLANHIARQSGLVKLSDATGRRPRTAGYLETTSTSRVATRLSRWRTLLRSGSGILDLVQHVSAASYTASWSHSNR